MDQEAKQRVLSVDATAAAVDVGVGEEELRGFDPVIAETRVPRSDEVGLADGGAGLLAGEVSGASGELRGRRVRRSRLRC